MTSQLPSIFANAKRLKDPPKIEDNEKSPKEKLKEIKEFLEQMSPTYLPKYYDFSVPDFTKEDFPSTYKGTSSIETNFFKIVKNFNRQYRKEFPSRKALLLNVRNEVGVKKFICTYICPVKWNYPEMYEWKGAASFVRDHLNFTALLPSTELPHRIYSSTTILKFQIGNCFDFSILLCSLLIGVGYDAYVVSGYATRECCYVDQTRTHCPLLVKPPLVLPIIPKEKITKYIVKPRKTFKSKFDLQQIAKEIQSKKDFESKQQRIEEEAKLEAEKPPPDPLFGMRVHAWVLVKAGQRDITEDFFIESLTGENYDLNTNIYQGVESLWNDKNYWANKFCCIKGLKEMDFNLKNLGIWEPMIPTEHFSNVHLKKAGHDDEEVIPEDICKTLDMPPTWVKNLNINLKDFEKRFPGFQKQTNFYKVQQFKYSPYYCLSGLETRLKIYDSRAMTNLVEVQEFLANREDKFYKNVVKNGWVTEHLLEGNEYNLKKHSFEKSNPGPENNREIEFYDNTRVDGLIKRIVTPASIEETYLNRKDFLYYMYANFAQRPETDDYDSYRNINTITKKFHRNPELKAEEDIAELTFQLNEDKIFIKYHIPDGGIIPNTREYLKPQPSTDGRNTIHLYPDTHTSFEANNLCKKKSNLEIYELLKALMKFEKDSIDDVRFCENDTKTIINNRIKAKRDDKIATSLFDTIRNIKAKKTRKEISKDYEMRLTAKETVLDFLDPYLAQQHITEITKKEEAYKVREGCLIDLKHRLIKQANLIRMRFDSETDQLQKKQTWYYQNKMMLSLEDEQKYLKYCTDTVALLDTLEYLLGRHQQTAPHKYMELERRIRKDPRMAPYL